MCSCFSNNLECYDWKLPNKSIANPDCVSVTNTRDSILRIQTSGFLITVLVFKLIHCTDCIAMHPSDAFRVSGKFCSRTADTGHSFQLCIKICYLIVRPHLWNRHTTVLSKRYLKVKPSQATLLKLIPELDNLKLSWASGLQSRGYSCATAHRHNPSTYLVACVAPWAGQLQRNRIICFIIWSYYITSQSGTVSKMTPYHIVKYFFIVGSWLANAEYILQLFVKMCCFAIEPFMRIWQLTFFSIISDAMSFLFSYRGLFPRW
jgi:hypothetical protein